LHGGEVTYMRALLFIAEAGLLPYRYVSKTYLKERIDSNRGYAFVSDHSVTTDSEVDFLKLGCVK